MTSPYRVALIAVICLAFIPDQSRVACAVAVLPGDTDLDGDVDGADGFLIVTDVTKDVSNLDEWEANYGLDFGGATFTLGTSTPVTQGTVTLSLNLFPTNTNAPAQGGTWSLTAKSIGGQGIAAIRAILYDVDSGVGNISVATDIGAIDPIDSGGSNSRDPYLSDGSTTELIYLQDVFSLGNVTTVGLAAHPSAIDDPLGNSLWNSATLIASGRVKMTSGRPSGIRRTVKVSPKRRRR